MSRRVSAGRLLVIIGLFGQVLNLAASELSTIYRRSLQPFLSATEKSGRPVTILSFGDSMADSFRSISFVLMNQFAARLGIAGYSFNNYFNSLQFNLTNGTQVLEPSSLWFSYHFRVPAGGGLWWTKQGSEGGIFSDKLDLFYVAQPNGGAFRVSISTNGGPWGEGIRLDGFALAPVGRFASLTVKPNYHRIRVDGIDGTNFILGSQLLNSRLSGVNIAFTDYQGISLADVTNVPLSIRVPIFRALSPDLLIWHMKEDGSEATRQRLIECEQWWSNAIPACCVLYLGTPYVALDTNSNWTFNQNSVVRSVATNYHRTYMDLMTPAVSYPWMVAHGYMDDPTHLNLKGSTYLAGFVWNDLGFFGLRLPRSLSATFVQDQIILNYATAANILYTLEFSKGQLWQPLFTILGDGSVFTTNFPTSAVRSSYRLRLAPGPN